MKIKSVWVFLLLATAGTGIDAWAIIGAPLTPLSFAGVARRTMRRSAYAGAAYGGYGGGYATAPVTTLPPSCVTTIVNGVTYQNCGGSYYQPTYSGPNVVYAPVQGVPTG